jgi:hypothetical protein
MKDRLLFHLTVACLSLGVGGYVALAASNALAGTILAPILSCISVLAIVAAVLCFPLLAFVAIGTGLAWIYFRLRAYLS